MHAYSANEASFKEPYTSLQAAWNDSLEGREKEKEEKLQRKQKKIDDEAAAESGRRGGGSRRGGGAFGSVDVVRSEEPDECGHRPVSRGGEA